MLYADTMQAEQTAVQVDVAQLLQRLRTDPVLFIQFFLGAELTLPVPAFHGELFTHITMTTKPRLAITVPRGHGKTTVVKLGVLYYLLFSSYSFIVYCSNTTTVAKDEARDIVAFLDSENFKAVFGKVQWLKRDESDGKFIFMLGKKRCILRALGAEQQIRGMNIDNKRPQVLICDDAESDDNSATEAQRTKFRNWVFGPLFKACARHSKKIWIGNIISRHCLINELCESPHWDSIKYGAILADGSVLWPEMFDIEYLKADFKEYDSMGLGHKWFAEMMNMIVPEGMGTIRAKDIIYSPWRVASDMEVCFITIDPAISKSQKANNSAIAVHGKIDNIWQIIEERHGKFDPLELFKETLALCLKWRVRVVGIESVAYQASLQTMFPFLFKLNGLSEMNVIPLIAGGRKSERIQAWAGMLKSGAYTLTEGDLDITGQLLNYNPAVEDNADDIIDACAYGPQVIAAHYGLLMAGPIKYDTFGKSEYAVCSF